MHALPKKQSAVAVLTPGAPIVNSITYKSTGIVLNITPRIGERGRIQLDVEPGRWFIARFLKCL